MGDQPAYWIEEDPSERGLLEWDLGATSLKPLQNSFWILPELNQRTGNSFNQLYIAWCILTVIRYILSCWGREAIQSHSLRKRPWAAMMWATQYMLFLSRRHWPRRFLLKKSFPACIVMTWLTANEEIVKELNSTHVYLPIFSMCAFNAFGVTQRSLASFPFLPTNFTFRP